MREIRVAKAAAKVRARVDEKTRKRLRDRIEELAKAPTERAAPLQAIPGGLWRARVGPWRIVYRFDEQTLWVDAIGVRGQIYREL